MKVCECKQECGEVRERGYKNQIKMSEKGSGCHRRSESMRGNKDGEIVQNKV